MFASGFFSDGTIPNRNLCVPHDISLVPGMDLPRGQTRRDERVLMSGSVGDANWPVRPLERGSMAKLQRVNSPEFFLVVFDISRVCRDLRTERPVLGFAGWTSLDYLDLINRLPSKTKEKLLGSKPCAVTEWG